MASYNLFSFFFILFVREFNPTPFLPHMAVSVGLAVNVAEARATLFLHVLKGSDDGVENVFHVYFLILYIDYRGFKPKSQHPRT
jgi:hypothetical protein